MPYVTSSGAAGLCPTPTVAPVGPLRADGRARSAVGGTRAAAADRVDTATLISRTDHHQQLVASADLMVRPPRLVSALDNDTAGHRPQLIPALTGRFPDHHAFLLPQMLRRVDAITADVATVQERIDA